MLFLAALLGVACGEPAADVDVGGSPVADDPSAEEPTSGPGSPVQSSPGVVAPEPGPQASPVEPQPGQQDVRAVGWDAAKPLGENEVRIRYWSGIEPCYVLDRVEVDYRQNAVEITLFEGHAPTEEDVACIELALLKQVTVTLDEPLGGRKVTDGTH